MLEYFRELMVMFFCLARFHEGQRNVFNDIGFNIYNDELVATIMFYENGEIGLSIYLKESETFIFSQQCAFNDIKVVFCQFQLFFSHIIDHQYIITENKIVCVYNKGIMFSVLMNEMNDLLEQSGIISNFAMVESEGLDSVVEGSHMIILMPDVENKDELIKKYDKVFVLHTLD